MKSKAGPVDRFADLRAARTSGEIRAAIAGMNDELQRLLHEHGEAEQARDKAILEGRDATEHRRRAVDLATEIADVQMVLASAEQRRAEAESREAQTELQDKAAEAKALGAELEATLSTV